MSKKLSLKAEQLPIFSISLHKREEEEHLLFQFYPPHPLESCPPNSTVVSITWETRYAIIRNKKRRNAMALGQNWLQSLLLAVEGARRHIPSGEEDVWHTDDGMPSWIIFPRLVPISWGHSVFSEIVRFSNWRIEEISSSAAKRNEK